MPPFSYGCEYDVGCCEEEATREDSSEGGRDRDASAWARAWACACNEEEWVRVREEPQMESLKGCHEGEEFIPF